MGCNKYICEQDGLSIGICSKGFAVILDVDTDSIVYAKIKDGSKSCIISTKTDCNSIAIFEYDIKGKSNIGNTIKVEFIFNNEPLAVRIGSLCEYQCGFEIKVTAGCSEEYQTINLNCYNASFKWEIPIENCDYKVKLENCEFTISNKTNKMKLVYKNQEFTLPTPFVDGAINPALQEELDMIESGVFTVTLVDDKVVVNYNGVAGLVSFIGDSCEEIERICI